MTDRKKPQKQKQEQVKKVKEKGELSDADLEKVTGGAYEFYVPILGTRQGAVKK